MKSGNYAMLDESLARQYEVSSDDTIKIGSLNFIVAGVVEKFPGGGALTATLAPGCLHLHVGLRFYGVGTIW
jgi:putative ABC transport system permease protein